MARGVFEYEVTGDGNRILSAHSVWKARTAFLDGDVTPLLELLDGISQPHLSQLLTDILTGKVKRPKHRPKKIHLSRNDIVSLGYRIEYFRNAWGMQRQAAIEIVAEGAPAIETLGWEEIPAIPKTRVRTAYARFQQLEREKPLTANRRSRKKSPSSAK